MILSGFSNLLVSLFPEQSPRCVAVKAATVGRGQVSFEFWYLR